MCCGLCRAATGGLNTETEDRELLADPHKPLTGGIPVELKAGDGVVYVNYLLHWGSNYSTRIRRTIHGGHSIFPHFRICRSATIFRRKRGRCSGRGRGWARRSRT